MAVAQDLAALLRLRHCRICIVVLRERVIIIITCVFTRIVVSVWVALQALDVETEEALEEVLVDLVEA